MCDTGNIKLIMPSSAEFGHMDDIDCKTYHSRKQQPKASTSIPWIYDSMKRSPKNETILTPSFDIKQRGEQARKRKRDGVRRRL